MQFLKLGSISPTINRFYFAKALSLRPFWSKKPPSTETRDGEPPSLIPLEPEQAEVKSVDTQEIRLEKFIPVTRRTLLRTLVEEKGFLKNEEREKMESLGASLNAKYSQTFYSILEEAKFLYDPMDPDKDTYQAREPSRKEVLDNEYYLLKKVEKLLDKGNFSEIPSENLMSLLHDRDTNGVIVSVNPSDYELLRIWTKGQDMKDRSLFLRMKDYIAGTLLRSKRSEVFHMTYTRVFVAVRSKKDKKLLLKMFKDVPTNELEHLLPRGKIKMSTFDKRFIASSMVLGVAFPLVKIMPMLSDFKIEWVWGGVGLAAFMGGRAWLGYKNKRNQYLANLATTLYFKTIANNRGVLTLLSDRAQDEEFKEALLVYAFLLAPVREKNSNLPVYDTAESLKSRIETWLQKHFQLTERFSFDVEDALNKLDDLGLLVERKNGTLTVVDMQTALSILPAPSETPWLTVGARRDSQSMDEQLREEKRPKHSLLAGWS